MAKWVVPESEEQEDIEKKYNEACERIFDILKQDDGQAFFEAERFLKRNRPDLYNKIGM